MKLSFERKRHIHFFTRILEILPNRYSQLDTSRLTIAFFAISGLDVLGALDTLSAKRKEEIITWIYSLQVIPNKAKTSLHKCGFRGSTSNGIATNQYAKTCETNMYDTSHITMTYTGLACLLILGDDLRLVNKSACLQGIKTLQLPNGSFKSTCGRGESDLRFIFCACCICAMLNDFSAIDRDLVSSYILKSMNHDGAFGQGPNLESHGGSTYCACASLELLGGLRAMLSAKQLKRLQFWLISRQKLGFHGRPHKDDDTCYSFWIGASLRLLGIFDLVDFEENNTFVLSTQDFVVGGFGKWPQMHPDALHSYMGICGLSLMGLHDLQPVAPDLNITVRAKEHMKLLHQKWEEQREQREETQQSVLKDENEHSTASHLMTVTLAFVIGIGAVSLPLVYNAYFGEI